MPQYSARANTPFRDKDAKIIGRFLDEQFPEGSYTPEEVVELARPKNSPIHKYFEWDDTRAAYLYRLQQARKMINCVVEIIDDITAPKAVSVVLSADGEDSHRAYVNSRQARKSPELWEQVLKSAAADLIAWKRRYEVFKQLKELRPVIASVKKLEKSLEKREKSRSKA